MLENNERIKQLLAEILANQQSLHEAFSAVHARLNEIEGSLSTIVRDHEQMVDQQDTETDEDTLFYVAREAVVDAGKASTSYLQRKLRIGYSRTARLMDLLENADVIGPADGSKPRDVLITKEELERIVSMEEGEDAEN